MITLIWVFIVALVCAVAILLWLQLRQAGTPVVATEQQQLEQKVLHLESHLKQTLEIMQDLVKKMHVQQEALDRTAKKTQQLELQNAELVSLLAKTVEVQMQQHQ